MRKLMRRRPSPAMLVAVIALVLALGGTAVAAKKLGLSALKDGAKNKTVGVGKLTYVTNTVQAQQPDQAVSVNCPSGLRVIGGGIKLNQPNVTGPDQSWVVDSYPTAVGWAGHVFFQDESQNATATAICANSRVVTGAPPNS
jgi:hypothetical protein